MLMVRSCWNQKKLEAGWLDALAHIGPTIFEYAWTSSMLNSFSFPTSLPVWRFLNDLKVRHMQIHMFWTIFIVLSNDASVLCRLKSKKIFDTSLHEFRQRNASYFFLWTPAASHEHESSMNLKCRHTVVALHCGALCFLAPKIQKKNILGLALPQRGGKL